MQWINQYTFKGEEVTMAVSCAKVQINKEQGISLEEGPEWTDPSEEIVPL